MKGRSSLPQDSTNLLPLLMSMMRGAGNNASVLLKGVNKVMIDFCDLSIGVSIIVSCVPEPERVDSIGRGLEHLGSSRGVVRSLRAIFRKVSSPNSDFHASARKLQKNLESNESGSNKEKRPHGAVRPGGGLLRPILQKTHW